MEKNIANELKKLDIEIAKKLFSISKIQNILEPPSPLQGRIMDYLTVNEGKEVYQKDLEKNLNVSKATISAVLFTMENNTLIKRITSKNDARSKQIILTEKSIKVYENMRVVFDNLNKELIKNLSEAEIESFLNTIEKLRKNIQ